MRNSPQIALIILLAALLLTACSSDRESRHSFKVEEIDGVLTAVNTGGPKYSEELFVYEKVLTLKQDPEQPESYLHFVNSRFLMDEKGFFYVEDIYERRIAVFDSAGCYLHSIGKPGGGPGEFGFVQLLDLRDDILHIWDNTLSRYTRFRTDGTLIDATICPDPVLLANYRTPYRAAEDLWVLTGISSSIEGNKRSFRAKFITITTQLDTLGMAETQLAPQEFRYRRYIGEELDRYGWRQMPYGPEVSAVFVPGRGVLQSIGAQPILWWYDLDGTLRQKVTLDLPLLSPTNEEKEAYRAYYGRRIEETSGRSQETLKAVLENLVFPDTKACWSSVSVDDAGFTWLRIPEAPTRQEGDRGYSYRILNPEGEYLGLTRAPEMGQIMNGCLLAMLEDLDTGEHIPTVWRLIPQPEGFRYP